MQPFVQGVLMGLGVSVPIGPVNVLIMSYALRSYTKALCLGLGAMSADMLYLALSALGISQLAKIPIVFACISVFGAAFLLYIALGIYRQAKRSVQLQSVELGSHVAVFGKGFFAKYFQPLRDYVLAKRVRKHRARALRARSCGACLRDVELDHALCASGL